MAQPGDSGAGAAPAPEPAPADADSTHAREASLAEGPATEAVAAEVVAATTAATESPAVPTEAPPAATTDSGAGGPADAPVTTASPDDTLVPQPDPSPAITLEPSGAADVDRPTAPTPPSGVVGLAVVATPEPARQWSAQPVHGPSGEQLRVQILAVVDPGDEILSSAGFRMEPGQRAVLVHSSVANTGQAPYYSPGDLNLVLENTSHLLLGRAAIAVASHPAFPVGVAPGTTVDGWSMFLIPSDTALAGIKWCIRPDLPQTILSWSIGG